MARAKKPENAAEPARNIAKAAQETGRALQDGETPEPNVFPNLPNPCVYCGPSVKGIARQYTTYQGGIPGALREFIREHPAALGLIVSSRKFEAMRRRLDTRGTPEAELYKQVKEELRRSFRSGNLI